MRYLAVEFPIRSQDITHWLNALVSGDGPHAPAVGNVLFAWLYEDLYRVARNHMRSFQLFPWLLVALGILHFTAPPTKAVLFSLAGGGMFLASFFFYFRALFRHADSPLIHVLWNVSVLVVPVMAWAWSDERLQPVHYVGIALAFVGSSLFAARNGLLRQGFLRVAGTMVWAVLLLSASMVLQKEAFRHASNQFLDVT